MNRYLQHVTLTTGHVRRSWRHEIDPVVMGTLRALVEAAQEPERCVPVPGTMPTLYLSIEATSRCALCNLTTEDGVPVVTFAVANHSRCGAQLWTLLRETASYPPVAVSEADRPDTPWCAERLEPGIALMSSETIAALGDMERCIAWAWIDSRRDA